MARVSFRAELTLLPRARKTPIFDDYRPDWDLGNTWLGEPELNGGRVRLDGISALAPGESGTVRIEPVIADAWARVQPRRALACCEGTHVVGHATIIEVRAPEHWTSDTAGFARSAVQFCAFIEHAPKYTLKERVVRARLSLLELYEAACSLPDIGGDAPDEADDPHRPAAWAGFAHLDAYWEVFGPRERSEPVAGSLSDDVLDTYVDIRRGLALWDQGSLAAAVWDWRFHFRAHWGAHAVGALRALHHVALW